MACNMPSRGEPLAIVEARDKPLREALREALDRRGPQRYIKISGLLDLGGTGCEFSLLVEEGRIIAACADCGKTVKGEGAVKTIRERMDDVSWRGYIEVLNVGEEGVEIDLEYEPESRLPEPMPLEELSEPLAESAQSPELSANAEMQPPQSMNSRLKPGEHLHTTSSPGPLSEAELANLIIYIVSRSAIIGYSNSVEELLAEARRRSAGDLAAFYRAVIEVSDRDFYNAFYKQGRLCSVIKLDMTTVTAQFLDDVGEEWLAKLARNSTGGARALYLYRVECPECEEALLRGCKKGGVGESRVKEEAGHGASMTGEARESKTRRPGLLRRLFGRR